MKNAFLASTVERHQHRLKRLQASITAVNNGLQIATEVDRQQALFFSIALLIGMPTAAVGLVLCGFLFHVWDGLGLWYGMISLTISAIAIRPALNPIDTQREALQERLLELVLQREKVREALEEVLLKVESPKPRKPIEVKEEAA